MGVLDNVLDRDNRFNNLLKAIKNSELIKSRKDYFTNYVNDVKHGNRNNDFYDDEFLERVILEVLNFGSYATKKTNPEDLFERLIARVKLMFPCGKSTDDYTVLKDIFINFISIDADLFNDKLLASFNNKRDYLEIINIINRDPRLLKRSSEIFDYGISVSPYCQNQDILKREIITFAYMVARCDDTIELAKDSLYKAKARAGIYSIDEKTLSLISNDIIVIKNLMTQVEDIQQRVNSCRDDVKCIIDKGRKDLSEQRTESINNLQRFVDEYKDSAIQVLDKNLEVIKENMKADSAKILNEHLLKKSKEITTLKIELEGIKANTTDEILRIKKTGQEVMDSLTNSPELLKMVKDSEDNKEIQKLLTILKENKSLITSLGKDGSSNNVEANSTNENTSSVVLGGVYIPNNERMVVPISGNLKLPSEIDPRYIPAFDPSIPFKVRRLKVFDRVKELRDQGMFFHPRMEEVLEDFILGDWVNLYGPSGSGKSFMLDQAAMILGLDALDNGSITTDYKLLGYNDAFNRFRATPLFICFVYGKMIKFEEFDSGNARTIVDSLNPFYTYMRNKVIHPEKDIHVLFGEDMMVPIHGNFRMGCTSNTPGKGPNELHPTRQKQDEANQQRVTSIYIAYDDTIERQIFGKYEAWKKFFFKFRDVCRLYVQDKNHDSTSKSLDYAQGMVTTRDADDIVRYIEAGAKSLDQIIREKFIQIKDAPYLSFIEEQFKREYSINNINDIPEGDLSKFKEEDLAKKLVYSCEREKTGIKNERKK